MFSQRRNARIALIQVLYAEIFIKNSNLHSLLDTYQDEISLSKIDEEYFSFIHQKIHKNFQALLGIILHLAPKFTIDKMPKIHSLILMITLTEIEFSADLGLDSKIAINEAIELAKIFSDTSGAKFINGILGNFIKNKESFVNIPPFDYQYFS